MLLVTLLLLWSLLNAAAGDPAVAVVSADAAAGDPAVAVVSADADV